MSKRTFQIIRQYFKDLPEFNSDHPGGEEPLSINKQLNVTLWYLGSCDSVDKIEDHFGISTSSVIRCRNRVTAINRHLKQHFIVWPSVQKAPEAIASFRQRNGFPGIVGTLDGTLLK